MKKKLALFSILSAFAVLGFGTLALLLPYLCDLYLLPRFLSDLPFTVKELSLSRITPWTIRGTLTLAGDDQPAIAVPRFELRYSPGSLIRGRITTLLLDSASLHIDLRNGRPVIHGLTTQPAASGQAQTSAAFTLPFAVETLVLKNLSLTLHPRGNEQITLTTDSRFTVGYRSRDEGRTVPATLSGEISAGGALAFTAGLEGKFTPDGHELDIRLQGLDIGRIATLLPALAPLQPLGRLTLTAHGKFALPEGNFNWAARITPEITGPPLSFSLEGSRRQDRLDMLFKLQGDAFSLADNFSFSPLVAHGNVTISGSSITGNLAAHLEKIVAKKEQTILNDLKLDVPFAFPLPHSVTPGTLSIDEIVFQGVNTGSLKSTVGPVARKFTFTSLFTTPLAPALQLSCDGSTEKSSELSLRCDLPETEIRSTSLAEVLKLPAELTFSGKLGAKGEITIKNGVPEGRFQAGWHNGTLTYGDTTLAQLDLNVDLPHLPLIESSPSQLCTIGSLNFGKVKATDARIAFRIESLESVFLEQSRFTWCGGKVDTGSIRLSRTMEVVATTLYCDRLSLSELLSQFGVDDAEGEGSLNGKLPIAVSRQGIVFDDGFLFSTPGKSGIVRFHNSKQLAAGRGDLNQAAYLDYSLMALENFTYNWTKLTFTSDHEELLVKMQLDGKPATPLPFGYQKGQIVKNDKGPGILHPVQLDVNFRLPTKDIFRYGKNIQSFMERMER